MDRRVDALIARTQSAKLWTGLWIIASGSLWIGAVNRLW